MNSSILNFKKLKDFLKRHFIVFISFFIFVPVVVAVAYYISNPNTSITVNEHNVCKIVKNDGSLNLSYYVPADFADEWQSFRDATPGFSDITLLDPSSCSSAGYVCGNLNNECTGGTTYCGDCPLGQNCVNGKCGSSTPQCTDSCSSKQYECGHYVFCGEEFSCGTCSGKNVCSAGKCVDPGNCKDTCSSKGYECGKPTLCGSAVSCGTCSGNKPVCDNSEYKCVECLIDSQCKSNEYCSNTKKCVIKEWSYWELSGQGYDGKTAGCALNKEDICGHGHWCEEGPLTPWDINGPQEKCSTSYCKIYKEGESTTYYALGCDKPLTVTCRRTLNENDCKKDESGGGGEVAVNGECINGGSYKNPPTESNACSKGTLFGMQTSKDQSEYRWICKGINGGADIGTCWAKKISTTQPPQPSQMQCGTSHQGSFYISPTSNLCSNGLTPSVAPTGDNKFVWTCGTLSCWALKKIDGECGSAQGNEYESEPPASEVCNKGSLSNMRQESGGGSTKFKWSCNGINNGNNVECLANKKSGGGGGGGGGGHTPPAR